MKTNYNENPFGPNRLEMENKQFGNTVYSSQQYAYTNAGQIAMNQFDTDSKQIITEYGYNKTRVDNYHFRLNTVRKTTTNFNYQNGLLDKVQTDGEQTKKFNDDTKYAKYEYTYSGKMNKITYPKLNDGSYLVTAYEYDGYDMIACRK